jgi:dATP pyrophosphohydrolase
MREPLTVLVQIFHTRQGGPRYAIFRRADDGNWQSVSGGVETGETTADTARRETAEETTLSAANPLYRLDMTSGVEKACFTASQHWPDTLYIVRKHYFALDATEDDTEIVLSAEHSEFQWATYEQAYQKLRYDDDKTALWELDTRLRNTDLPPAVMPSVPE